TGALTAASLRLLGNGAATLNSAGNDVETFAANRAGVVSFRDADDLAVGTVLGTVGVVTAGSNAALQAGTTLVIDDDVNVGAGSLTLDAGVAVTQVAGDTVTGAGLELLGAGDVTLTDAGNEIATLAGNTTGNVRFNDGTGFDIGTVGTVGLTTTGDIQLTSAGAITQSQLLAAAGLELLGAGGATLSNAGNAVTTLAIDKGGAAVSYRDSDALTVGTVNTVGLRTTGGSVTLQTAGALLVDDDIDLGAGNLTLNVVGGITQGPGKTIAAAGLELLGTGATTLTDAGNDIDNLAASRAGVLSYADADEVRVSTVNGTSGIVSGGNDVTLTSRGTAGDIIFDDLVNVGAGTGTFVAGRDIRSVQGAAVDVAAASASLQAGADSSATGTIGVTGGDSVETSVTGTLALSTDTAGASAIVVDNGASATLTDLVITLADTSAGVSVVANTGDTVTMAAG
ncbi:MAG: FG-GAP repeat protein, partial [Acidimicrobiaceae bacterium]